QIGCTRVVSIPINGAPPLSVDAGPDQATCEEQVTLNASGVNNTGFFEWSLSPDFDVLINQNGSPTVEVIPGANTFYYVRTFNNLGCEIVDTVVIQGQSVNIELIGENRICFPDTTVLEVINLDPNDELTYSWSPLASIIPPTDGAIVQVNPTNLTNYLVVAENQFGCTQSAEFSVDVSSEIPPIAVFAEPDTIFAGQTTQLSSTLDPDYNYQWMPVGSLSDPTIPDPVASPVETTTYLLTINDEFNCRNQAEVTVYLKSFVCDDPFIFVPNAFTPNGDGLNDLLFVRGNVITDFYFAVYNRWGERVFETENQSIGWDGQFRGQQLPPDVFGYYLRAVCLDGQEFFKKGNVSILR
ncbi:MAG: gliding motility-associated C-terminal domain-containing protein, partial [Bacteroidota bacterium]